MARTSTRPRFVLSVAGTDPSSAAGIQVDLQVFRDMGCHGLSAVTAVVWQNTQGVRGFEPMSGAVVAAQLEAVIEDLPVDAIKLGMLPSAEVVEVVADYMARWRARGVPVVCDPVLASGDGQVALASSQVVDAMRRRLLPVVDVLTPNVPEAVALLGGQPFERLAQGAQALLELGPQAVLLKAGHWQDAQVEGFADCWADAQGVRLMPALPGIDEDVRGTGCQLSSALAAGLAGGHTPYEAASRARELLNGWLWRRRLSPGKGRAMIVRVDGDQ